MITSTKTSYSTRPEAMRLGSSWIVALALLFGGLGMSSPSHATPLIGNIDVAGYLDSVDANSDLFLEAGGFKRFGKFRSQRGRSFHGRQFNRFGSFRGRPFKSFRSFHGKRHQFFGPRRHRFSRFH